MIIFNKSLEDHLQTLDKLFTKIDELNLKLNRSKCLFGKNEIKFVGVESNNNVERWRKS